MKFSVRYLPIIIANTLLLTTIITTTLAYYYGHVTHIIPYISDTGTLPPESCFFGQFLNIIWLLLSAAMYLKFKQVQDILSKHNMTHKNNLNKFTAIIGLTAAFGVSIVANFQETNMFIVHWIGAVMAFGGGAVYVCLQTSLYLTIAPVIGQMFLTKVRIGVSALTVVSFLIYFIAAMISYTKFNGQNYLSWTKEDGGFEWHNTSTITEWICSISIMVYIMLMGDEFKTLTVYEPEIDVGLNQRSSS
ncbi:unnamed protein product [Psylliodes chrysocephalus]|uniref:CWH43-like N-terminal domain-containing protein n=1 Tax=Psylliodes chrysocephalus TaxID=3402493 RepID=A0A9P0DDL7_9CUCU|nr:unnamed protein product [Psylliodes chrysocephala]